MSVRTLDSMERNALLMLSRGLNHDEVAVRLRVEPEAVYRAAERAKAKLEGLPYWLSCDMIAGIGAEGPLPNRKVRPDGHRNQDEGPA